MFVDGNSMSADVETDVCIVGAGAAGLSLALELEGSGRSTVVLESGGFTFDPEVQALAQGRHVGLPSDELLGSRVRAFGGSTSIWGGWCRPLDPIDFERRPWVPHSGWPIRREDLDPYYERALSICGVEPRGYDLRRWSEPEQILEDGRWENIVFLISAGPAHFGERYRAALDRAEDVRVLLHSTAVHLEVAEQRIERISVKTLKGRAFSVRARIFVLAGGAIENARLLLVSNLDVRGLAGRFFMQHPHLDGARLMVRSRGAMALLARGAEHRDVGITSRVSDAMQREHQIGNMHLLAMSGRTINATVFERLRSLWTRIARPGSARRPLAEIIPDLTHPDRAERSRAGEVVEVRIAERPEQAPNPESRVLLDETRDALGVLLPKIDWRWTELDRRTLDVSAKLLAQTVGVHRIGRLRRRRLDPTEMDRPIHGGFHHLGTARMSASASEGVVDPSCKVHDLQNLYVAGSAVFPTSGYANPTLTIVALSLRLADTLRRELSPPP